ncbi:MAG: DUF1045 domain-containing protein [Shimia sp.]
MSYARFAVYYVPAPGPLAAFGARWLGWDIHEGEPAPLFDVAGLEAATATPRKYGFHGTLKPPFRLREGRTVAQLRDATAQVAATLPPAECGGLELATLGRFLALVPTEPQEGLARVAAACVEGLDPFRAPPTEAELARRRAAGLSPRQEARLLRWGYPYVMEEFRFHLTLTGRLERDMLADWQAVVRATLPPLPERFVVDHITLCGERADGRFEVLHRYPLTG